MAACRRLRWRPVHRSGDFLSALAWIRSLGGCPLDDCQFPEGQPASERSHRSRLGANPQVGQRRDPQRGWADLAAQGWGHQPLPPEAKPGLVLGAAQATWSTSLPAGCRPHSCQSTSRWAELRSTHNTARATQSGQWVIDTAQRPRRPKVWQRCRRPVRQRHALTSLRPRRFGGSASQDYW